MPTPHESLFAYQPILDRDGDTVAFSIRYRHAMSGVEDEDDAVATARIIVDAYLNAEVVELLGVRKAFVQISPEFLESGMISMLPPGKTILELVGHRGFSEETRAQCAGYRQMGYALALGDFVPVPDMIRALDLFDIVKLDVAAISSEHVAEVMTIFAGRPLKTLAKNVATQQVYEQCRAWGFDLFQGHYFAYPDVLVTQKPDPRRTKVLVILAMIENDAGDRDIEDALKLSPEVTLHLLRLANSAAFGMRSQIGSVRELLNIFGRSKLARWLQVLLFIAQEEGSSIALFELAARRGRFIEILVQNVTHQFGSSQQDKGFMVGMLSLVDVLLGVSPEGVLPDIGVADDIREAIMTRSGMFGALLSLCEALENADFDAIAELCAALGVTEGRVMEVQRDAMLWALSAVGEVAAATE